MFLQLVEDEVNVAEVLQPRQAEDQNVIKKERISGGMTV
jgi:hypothetical protein